VNRQLSPSGAETVTTYDNSPLMYQYSTSLHWAFSQTTPGSMQVFAYNSSERVYNIFCLLFGVVIFGSLVSTLSAIIMGLRVSSRDRQQKFKQLHLFLTQSGVTGSLAREIHRELQHSLNSKDVVARHEDVVLLQLLSPGLLTRLQETCFASFAKTLSFNQMWALIDAPSLQELLADGMSFSYFQKAHWVFRLASSSYATYLGMTGEMSYTQSPDVLTETTTVSRGAWIAEASLWTQWIHVGDLTAMCFCKVVVLDAAAFCRTILKHHVIGALGQQYARTFLRRIQACGPPLAPWPNDLQAAFASYGEILPALPHDSRAMIGKATLQYAIKQARRFNGDGTIPAMEELEREIAKGESALVVNSRGEVERVASLVIVQASNSAGLLLVRLGKWNEGDGLVTRFGLPGTFVRGDEKPKESLLKYMEVNLKLVPQDIQWAHTPPEQMSTTKLSHSYAMKTKMNRTLYYAGFCDGVNAASHLYVESKSSLTTENSGTQSSGQGSRETGRRQVSVSSQNDTQLSRTDTRAKSMRISTVSLRKPKRDPSVHDSFRPEVFCLGRGKGKGSKGKILEFFAWIPKDVFEDVSAEDDEESSTVARWLSSMDITEDIVATIVASLHTNEPCWARSV